MIRNVLVAVDGSHNSNRALDFSLDLAEKYGAVVRVLNVSESLDMGAVPLEPTTISGESMVIFAEDLQRVLEEILNKAIVHAKEVNPNVEGSSKEVGFDIIVVGHHGLRRVRELFLGNIGEKVAHLAPCPVVIVR